MVNSKVAAAVRSILLGCMTKDVIGNIEKSAENAEWSMTCINRIMKALFDSCNLINDAMIGLLRSIKHEHSDVRKLVTTVFTDETNNNDFKQKFVKNLLLADINEDLEKIENHDVSTIWSSDKEWPRIDKAKKLFYDSKQQHIDETVTITMKAINVLLFSSNN